MGYRFGTDPRSSNDLSSVFKCGIKPWSQKDVIELAKLQIKATQVIMGGSLIYEKRLKCLSMSKLSQMMTKVKYGNIYKYLKGLNTRGIHQCEKFMVPFYTFLCICDAKFCLHYCLDLPNSFA